MACELTVTAQPRAVTREGGLARDARPSQRSPLSRICASSTVMASPTASVRSTASTPSSRRARRQCSSAGCSKVDAGGGFCVAHGGGKKCSFPGCTKGYQTGGYCRKHGGGARCHVSGCAKVDAGKGLCRAHGGGKRCQSPGCPKADVGGGFCTAHGGGRRCSEPGCAKIDQGGGKCRAHGGAKRCKKPDCDQPARGATGFCPDHGGAKVCATPNCRRLARTGGEDGAVCGACATEKLLSATPPDGVDKPLAVVLAAVEAAKSGEWVTSANLDDAKRTSRPYLEGTDGSGDNTSEEALSVKCDGSQVASCLDNGCSRSYGGRCNCIENCTCNHSSPTSSTSLMLGQGTATAIPQASTNRQVKHALHGGIKRSLLQVQLLEKAAASGLPVATIVAMITAIPAVRSAHVLPDSSASQLAASHLVVVHANGPVDWGASLSSLTSLELCHIDVVEESELAWPPKEVVLTVEGMMCPGNCGATVMAAVRAADKVELAQLIFEARQVVVRGEMHVDDLYNAINAVGFDVSAAEVTPLARRFRLRVAEMALASRGGALKQALEHVEGVEELVVLVDSLEVLVTGTLANATALIDAAMGSGFTLFDVSDDRNHSRPISPPTLSWSPALIASEFSDASPSTGFNTAEGGHPSHTCDTVVCPQNSCPRYMMSLAHTAALAVGWSIPGCGMANGRECTCGDSCKCKGCPKHNPVT
jgi:hypothetical protein